MSNMCYLIRVSSIVAQLVQCGQIPVCEWYSLSTVHSGIIEQSKAFLVQCSTVLQYDRGLSRADWSWTVSTPPYSSLFLFYPSPVSL